MNHTNAPEPGKFRKKPVVIEAVQWFKHGDHPRVLTAPLQPINGYVLDVHGWIQTLEGGHIVTPGDWIITGVKGEQYPCKPDIFAATYEPAALATPPIAVQPSIGAQELASMLVFGGFMDAAAQDDPEGFDNYRTMEKVGYLAQLINARTGPADSSQQGCVPAATAARSDVQDEKGES